MSAFAFVLATSCCWFVGVIGSLRKIQRVADGRGHCVGGLGWVAIWAEKKTCQAGNVVLQWLLTFPSCGFQKMENHADGCLAILL